VESFAQYWQFGKLDRDRSSRIAEWTENLAVGRATLTNLINETERRFEELGQTKPTVFLIYVDQGEELYVRAPEHDRRCFLEALAKGLGDPRLRVLMTMRADFFGELQRDEILFRVHQLISVTPMRETEMRQVVEKPAALLSARFETDQLPGDMVRGFYEDSVRDSGALPLLSYTLEDMWSAMIQRGDGVLRLPSQAIGPAGVLVARATAFLATHPGVETTLRRILTLRCATITEDGEPTRRRAARSEFTDEEWRLVSELADYPNRLLVIVTSETGETYAEVAHEAIFRRWDRLREWIAAEREFLAWRSGLEAARRAWVATPDDSKPDALLMGVALTQARSWLAHRAKDLARLDRDFIAQSIAREQKAQARARVVRASIYGLGVVLILGLVGWINQTTIADEWRLLTVTRPYERANVRPYVLSTAHEQALKPGDPFKECAQNCPDMVVVPAGSFLMGSPVTEPGRSEDEGPQHEVTITRPFAVSKYELTFADWAACVTGGGCSGYLPIDAGWGQGRQPVIYVSWDDAHRYAAWLSQVTGKTYRLLSEAEYEYAARGGTTTAYPWGDDIMLSGKAMANCNGCGSQWDNKRTAPVGSCASNQFGLSDMVGNLFEWTEDCYHDSYAGAPTDGSAWLAGDCSQRIVRGGSWASPPRHVRAASRLRSSTAGRTNNLGIRIGRTLGP
jgi:formylglycine-generating enzyme required for sulfatase activity